MTTHKNTNQHKTIATLLLFSIGLLFSCNTFAWTHHIGEKYGGGIVFYVYDGGLHGLIAARRGCKPEPQKILSPQFQSFHERIQVEQFAVALEGVMSIE